jgi:sterol desaturase/sphingolipid hydroxylase (fatty acid hydroxylase superfamily)
LFVLIRYSATSPLVPVALTRLTLANTIVALVLMFAIYDFVYTIMHWVMHIRVLYPLVHKHHHRQHVPTRGNVDAVNVHPLEFVLGEFLHLGCLATLNFIGLEVHALTVFFFIIIGGILASLNHTRADVRIPPSIYDVRCVVAAQV